MEIQYLKTVLLVATHLNFSKVAEEIPCAPSSVSRQVKCVEEALGITLFDRPVRGERLKLTGPGTSVLPYIAQVVGQYESLEFHISRLKGQDEKPYTIGLPLGRISIKTECLLMEKFYLFAPGHNIQFLFYQSSEVEACLRSREFDALLVTRVFWQEDRNKTPAFCTIPGTRCTLLHNQPLCIVMRADHPLAGQAEVDVGDLREQSFILYYDPIREGIPYRRYSNRRFSPSLPASRICAQAGDHLQEHLRAAQCMRRKLQLGLPHLPAELDASLFPDSGCPTEGSPVWL